MKRVKIILGTLSILTLVVLVGIGLFRHFITNQIMDGDNMENPFPPEIAVENTAVSETAELVSFSWHQSAMNYYDCFSFDFFSNGQNGPALRCKYTNGETGECIEIGDWDDETCVPFPSEKWEALSHFLRGAELPAYCEPDLEISDATDSSICVTWRDGEEQFTNHYDGECAHDLLALVKGITQEVYTAVPGPASAQDCIT